MQKILIVDDETPIVDSLEKLFSTEQIRLVSADDRATAEELVRTEFFPVILADVRLRTESEALRLLESIRRLSPRSKVASLIGYATPPLEDQLKQHGVYVVCASRSTLMSSFASSGACLRAEAKLLNVIESRL